MLRLGDSGPDVGKLQYALGITQDDDFGPLTEAALKKYQSAHGLVADGIAGPKTLASIHGVTAVPLKPSVIPSLDLSPYRQLFDSMTIRNNWVGRANTNADLVLRGRSRYEALASQVHIPWYLIGCIHLMEGDCSFNTHLHNGDSLKARTHNVPAGRPHAGNPPFTWEESAIDALNFDNIKPPQDTIGQQFGSLEKFNGMGYRSHGINSPYLWSGSNHYTSGKYVSDGVWSSTAVSGQVGAACIYKILSDRKLIVF